MNSSITFFVPIKIPRITKKQSRILSRNRDICDRSDTTLHTASTAKENMYMHLNNYILYSVHTKELQNS